MNWCSGFSPSSEGGKETVCHSERKRRIFPSHSHSPVGELLAAPANNAGAGFPARGMSLNPSTIVPMVPLPLGKGGSHPLHWISCHSEYGAFFTFQKHSSYNAQNQTPPTSVGVPSRQIHFAERVFNRGTPLGLPNGEVLSIA